jgi:hypothetical protein
MQGWIVNDDPNINIFFGIKNIYDFQSILATSVYNYGEPILVWVTADYNGSTTSYRLATHPNPKNYYSIDWDTHTLSVNGTRKQMSGVLTRLGSQSSYNRMRKIGISEFGFIDSYVPIQTTDDTDYATSTDPFKQFFASRVATAKYLYGDDQSGTFIDIEDVNYPSGTLMFQMRPNNENSDYDWWNIGLWHHLALTWDSSSSGTPLYVNGIYQSDDHYFDTHYTDFDGDIRNIKVYDEILSSSGILADYNSSKTVSVNWSVPNGSGEASWSTVYNLNDIIENSDKDLYELLNPVTTAGTNYVSNSGVIIVEVDVENNTNHPSGLNLTLDVEFDSGSTDKWKVWRTEFDTPSGTHIGQHLFTKHIGMGGQPIRYSDIYSINLNLTTKYVDIGSQQYYGDVKINSVKVYFESTCVASTGSNDIDLYTYGSPTTPSNELDLFTDGVITEDGDLDLFVEGVPSVASGDISLFTVSDNYRIDKRDFTLFIEGLTPETASSGVNLYLWGTNEPAIRDHVTLFVNTEGLFEPEHMLPLFLEADLNDETSDTLNLFVKNYPWLHLDTAFDNNVVSTSGAYINIEDFNEPSGTLMFWMKPYEANTDFGWWAVNQWQHVAITWDSSNSETPLYVNGNSQGNDHYFDNHYTYFNGKINDFRVYNEILSIDDINAIITNTDFVSGLSLFVSGPGGIKGIINNNKSRLDDDYYLDLFFGRTETDPINQNVINLCVIGKGITDGYYPSKADMPLFIARDSEGVTHQMSLFLAQKDVTDNLDAIISGHLPLSSSIILYVKGSGDPHSSMKLYTHGF